MDLKINKKIYELMSNPNKVLREEKMLEETIVDLAAENIKLQQKINKLEKEKPVCPTYKPPICEEDLELPIDSLESMKVNTDIYNKFFESVQKDVEDTIDQIINMRDILIKTPTIGDASYDIFKSKDKINDEAVFIGKNEDKDHYKKFLKLFIEFEDKRTLNNVSTEFVTNYFIKDKSKYLHFLISIFDIFTQKILELDIIKDKFNIGFTFKGGNLIKLYFDRITNDLTTNVKDYIKFKFQDSFKESDFDFDFKLKQIDNTIDDYTYNITRVKITNMLGLLLLLIKKIIINNRNYFINFYNLNEKSQKEILKSLLIEYNKQLDILSKNDNVKDLKGARVVTIIYDYENNNYKYYGETNQYNEIKNNFVILNDDKIQKTCESESNDKFYIMNYNNFLKNKLNIDETKYPKYKELYDLMLTNNFYYNTLNTNIQFKQSAFSLIRIKINFIVGIKYPNNSFNWLSMPGELLDLSIPKKDDYKDSDFSNINIQNIDKTIKMQTQQGIINDIEQILFYDTNNKPWTDQKYPKRIKRLLFLILLSLLYENQNIKFKNKIKKVELAINIINNNFSENIDNIDFYNDSLKNFIYNVKDSFKNINSSEQDDFNNYKENIINIMTTLLKALKLHYNVTIKKGHVYLISYLNGFS